MRVQLDRNAADLNLDRGERKEPAGAYRRDRKHRDVDRASISLIVRCHASADDKFPYPRLQF
jgi:hypothetical protein